MKRGSRVKASLSQSNFRTLLGKLPEDRILPKKESQVQRCHILLSFIVRHHTSSADRLYYAIDSDICQGVSFSM